MLTAAQHINWLGSASRSQVTCEPTGIMGAGIKEPKSLVEFNYPRNFKLDMNQEGWGGKRK